MAWQLSVADRTLFSLAGSGKRDEGEKYFLASFLVRPKYPELCEESSSHRKRHIKKFRTTNYGNLDGNHTSFLAR